MAVIHAFVQSKTTGKSLMAAFLTQYLRDRRGLRVACVDTELMLNSFTRFEALGVEPVTVRDLPTYCRNISSKIAHVVIDTSVAGFEPFCKQLRDAFLPALAEARHSFRLHTVVTGGGQIMETYNGFQNLAANFSDLPIIVWLNPHYGEIAVEDTPFEASGVFSRHKTTVRGLVPLPNRPMAANDVRDMYARHQTFKEAQDSPDLSIGVKMRLKSYQEAVFEAIEQAALGE